MEDIYKKLREWMHNASPNGFRETDSGVELDLLKYIFTPEEARLALQLSVELNSLERIAEAAGISPDETEKILDRIYLKGAIRRHADGNGKKYAALPFFPGIAENLLFTGRGDKKLNDLVFLALKANWIPSFNEKIGTSRTLPVGYTVPAESTNLPYQDAAEQVKNAAQPILVFPCHCRVDKKDRCDAPMEVCMAFGDHAQFYLDKGGDVGRKIDVEEALRILKIAEDAGLVHQLTNYKDKDLSWLCNCCSCCCFNLSVGNKFFPNGRVRNIEPSAFIAVVDGDLCTGCGLCVEKCPAHALEMKDDVSVLKEDRCIGCGQCVTQCPVQAIQLVKRADDRIPPIPQNLQELIDLQHAAQAAKDNLPTGR